MTTPSMSREVEKRLSDHDARYTPGRRKVVANLASSEGPKSAAELYARIGPGVPLSSLYRSLAVLEEAGVVAPHFSSKGVTRYELAEWLQGHHHHLICVDCGTVEDIAIPHRFETQVQALVDDISSIAAFTASNHALEIEGQCARCI